MSVSPVPEIIVPRPLLVTLFGIVIALAAGVLWRRWRRAQLRAKRQLAALEFAEQLDALESQFLQVASATGMPRGLRWKQCEMGDKRVFAVDRVSGELYALVETTVSFEAIPGGGMEDVEAVGNLRSATAIFVHRQGDWATDGRVVFNLEPAQAAEHYQESLAVWE